MSDPRNTTAIVWLRNDLRLSDNPALHYALRHHSKVACVYIDERAADDNPPANAWWLREALLDLSGQLEGRLLFRRGDAAEALDTLVEKLQAAAVYWNRRYEPQQRALDSRIKQSLKSRGLSVGSFCGNLLYEPWEIAKADGGPYRVFTPFYKMARQQGLVEPTAMPDAPLLSKLQAGDRSDRKAIEALPTFTWASSFAAHWQPTRSSALERLRDFRAQAIAHYQDHRNLPAEPGVSRLSPYLHFGQIGVREIAAQVEHDAGAEDFLRELIWREFAVYIQYHWPEALEHPMDKRFEQMPWRDDGEALAAWQRGRTGIPMVDAGMRELWHTGLMHNRVRMVVASFLCKHLLIDWRRGADWFEYTLLDADLPNNRMGWQWCAGSGVDAAPYFRVFNPASQGQRFDKDGDYVRRWVPELAKLPNKWLNQPWDAPHDVLKSAGVKLGGNYPKPLIGLKEGRERALKAWELLRT